MLLTIHNLPAKTRYNDVKSLIQTKCGLEEVILDNLTLRHNSKKVTVGLAEEEDAAILVRKLNGLLVDGQQLYVEAIKKKGPPSLMDEGGNQQQQPMLQQPYYQQQQQNYQPNYQLGFTEMQQGTQSMGVPTMPYGGMYGVPENASANYGYPQQMQYQQTPQQLMAQSMAGYDSRAPLGFGNQDTNPSVWSGQNDWSLAGNASGGNEGSQQGRVGTRWESDSSSHPRRSSPARESRRDRPSRFEPEVPPRDSGRDAPRRDFGRDAPSRDRDRDAPRDQGRGRDQGRDRNQGRDRDRDQRRDRGREAPARDREREPLGRNAPFRETRARESPVRNASFREPLDRNTSFREPLDRNAPFREPLDRNAQLREPPGRNALLREPPSRNALLRDPPGRNASLREPPVPAPGPPARNAPLRDHGRDTLYQRRPESTRATKRRPSPPSTIYGEHVTGSSPQMRTFSHQRDGPKSNQPMNKPQPKPVKADSNYVPPSKRPKRTGVDDKPYVKPTANTSAYKNQTLQTPEIDEKAFIRHTTWRYQIAAQISKEIMNNPKHTSNIARGKIYTELKRIIKSRLDDLFGENYLIRMVRMIIAYRERFPEKKDTVLYDQVVADIKIIEDAAAKAALATDKPDDAPKEAKPQSASKEPTPDAASKEPTPDAASKEATPNGASKDPKPQVAPKEPKPQAASKDPKPDAAPKEPKPQVASNKPKPQVAPNKPKPQVAPNKPKSKAPKKPVQPTAAQNVQTPTTIPSYPQGDKKTNKELKRESAQIFQDIDILLSKMDARTQQALVDEIDEMCDVVIKDIDENSDPKLSGFEKRVKTTAMDDLKKMMKVNLAKRILNIGPIMLRIFNANKTVSRGKLAPALAQFGITSLRKSERSKPGIYFGTCESYDDHDRLIAMEPILVDGAIVTFKPFHLTGKEKPNKPIQAKNMQTVNKQNVPTVKKPNQAKNMPAVNKPAEKKDYALLRELKALQKEAEEYDKANADWNQTTDANNEWQEDNENPETVTLETDTQDTEIGHDEDTNGNINLESETQDNIEDNAQQADEDANTTDIIAEDAEENTDKSNETCENDNVEQETTEVCNTDTTPNESQNLAYNYEDFTTDVDVGSKNEEDSFKIETETNLEAEKDLTEFDAEELEDFRGQNIIDEIDMADLNDDDLEDW